MASKPKKVQEKKAKKPKTDKPKGKAKTVDIDDNDEPMPSDPVDVKEHIGMRWDLTQSGKLQIYTGVDEDESEEKAPVCSTVPGVITHAEYKQVSMVLATGDDENEKAKKVPVHSNEWKNWQKIILFSQ